MVEERIPCGLHKYIIAAWKIETLFYRYNNNNTNDIRGNTVIRMLYKLIISHTCGENSRNFVSNIFIISVYIIFFNKPRIIHFAMYYDIRYVLYYPIFKIYQLHVIFQTSLLFI